MNDKKQLQCFQDGERIVVDLDFNESDHILVYCSEDCANFDKEMNCKKNWMSNTDLEPSKNCPLWYISTLLDCYIDYEKFKSEWKVSNEH